MSQYPEWWEPEVLAKKEIKLRSISSKIPLLLSKFFGNLSLLTWNRLGRQIYLLKN